MKCFGDGEVGVVTREEQGGEEAHRLVYVSVRCPVFCAKALPMWHQADLSHRTKIQSFSLATHGIFSQSGGY